MENIFYFEVKHKEKTEILHLFERRRAFALLFFDKLRNLYFFLYKKMIYLCRIDIGLTSEV